MTTKEFQISNPDLISMIHKVCPEGVKYAKDVINLAVELNEVSKSFSGNVINDYGVYPFLNVEEIHTQKDSVVKDHVIISSEFDRATFDQFIASLSISCKDFEDIMADIDTSYRKSDDLLDISYLTVMRYLMQYLKCLEQRREDRKAFVEELFRLPAGYSKVITTNGIITLEYICKRLHRHNKNRSLSTGKWFKVLQYPDANRAFIVSCEKYRSK